MNNPSLEGAARGEHEHQVIIRHTPEGIFVQHNFDNLVDLVQSALTLVRGVAESLRQSDAAAHEMFARRVANAAQEGGVTPTPLEPQ